ncbi:hypothetical protein ACFOG5_01795 [Pedobacter fastidiosus]|uniref:hypothetical protein n=1 Tax=Pedobacter fastidiosus TaxID=2765361 RepID=UPI00361D888A
MERTETCFKMSENLIDSIGNTFWYLMFLTPLLTVPLTFRLSTGSKTYKIIIAIILAVILSTAFYFISMSIILRDGLGPS